MRPASVSMAPFRPLSSKGTPELILKNFDAARNRRLRSIELAGRAGNPAELGNRDKSLQVMQVHRPSEKLM